MNSLEEILYKINVRPNNTYFLVPIDIYGIESKWMGGDKAAEYLTCFYNYWQRHNIPTIFNTYGKGYERIEVDKKKFETRPVVKIRIQNKEIEEYLLNMHLIQN